MKLTKAIKQAIVDAAIKKAGILDREAIICKRYADFAESVRRAVVTDEQLELIEKAKAASELVDSSLRESRFRPNAHYYIQLNAAGTRRTFYWCGAQDWDSANDIKDTRITPDEVTLKADSKFMETLNAIDRDADAIKAEREHLDLSLWATLNSVTTDKKLYEIWPEAVAFVPAAEQAASPNLPALPIAELNKLIGLP